MSILHGKHKIKEIDESRCTIVEIFSGIILHVGRGGIDPVSQISIPVFFIFSNVLLKTTMVSKFISTKEEIILLAAPPKPITRAVPLAVFLRLTFFIFFSRWPK